MNVPLTATITGITLAIGIPLIVGTVAVHQKESLHGATDNAALSAADEVVGYSAHQTLTRAEPRYLSLKVQAAQLESCEVETETGHVRVTASKQTIIGRVYARAHSGPGDSPPSSESLRDGVSHTSPRKETYMSSRSFPNVHLQPTAQSATFSRRWRTVCMSIITLCAIIFGTGIGPFAPSPPHTQQEKEQGSHSRTSGLPIRD